MTADPKSKPLPERFVVAPATLWFDRFMNHFIKVGGLAIIVAVSLIFIFILLQIIPLFRGARVEPAGSSPIPAGDYVLMGMDEWGELPFFLDTEGQLHFVDTLDPDGPHHRDPFTKGPSFARERGISFVHYLAYQQQLLYGTDDGHFSIIDIRYRPTFPDRGGREIQVALSESPLFPIGHEDQPILKLAYGDGAGRKLVGALQRMNDTYSLHAVTLLQRRSLMGAGETVVDRNFDLSHYVDGEPSHLLIPADADALLITFTDGRVRYLHFNGREFTERQVFTPFSHEDDPRLASLHFLLGDVSLVMTSTTGANKIYSIYRDPELDMRIWGHTKTFPPLTGGATVYSAAMRNKAFLIGRDRFASLRYGTTESTRWETELPFDIQFALLGPRYNRLFFLDTDFILHDYTLNDPHPQAGWRTYFGRIQYEGQATAEFTWQSTGGRDDFERKLSLVPLIIGTLKGTLYALLFALPIALLAALYTSQFLKPKIKRYVKPLMEIMASLPSVVLGFLAALWLAPIISNDVPAVILAIAGVTAAAYGFGFVWGHLPQRIRLRLKPGYEFLVFMPLMAFAAWIGWSLGPIIEQHFFVVTDPITGLQVADFRLWFPTVTGLGFEQRNAFVVGFVMGFAVIPIIFTITEDALSNVPDAFRSGSLALGASRWQTAINIVLPTASAGIFSAVMIGLGRAVGETMIVVMATGNTPVTDLNPFTGMRTLSANIAVELPEAPYLGTLYRTLFLGAMVLFLMTFIVNTIAEILRQHLREKYKAVE